jgi:hypothetical protein
VSNITGSSGPPLKELNMFYMLPKKKKNRGDTMDLNTLMQFAAFIEQKQKEAKDGAKPKEEEKKKGGGDYWKTFLVLMIITPPVAITYLLALVFGVLQIVKVAKGI